MVNWYHDVYDKARKMKVPHKEFKRTLLNLRIMESLGTSLIEAIMILIEFTQFYSV